jgi:hypothetical protein
MVLVVLPKKKEKILRKAYNIVYEYDEEKIK